MRSTSTNYDWNQVKIGFKDQSTKLFRKPKLIENAKLTQGCTRHSCNEYLAIVEMSIETFYLCVFSRKSGWDGQGEVSKEKGDH